MSDIHLVTVWGVNTSQTVNMVLQALCSWHLKCLRGLRPFGEVTDYYSSNLNNF